MRKNAICLTNGRVGKTTTAVNLAACLASAGSKVLLIDTDTQGQVNFMLGIQSKVGLAKLITEELEPEEAIVAAREGLWLLTGGGDLAGVKRLIALIDFGGEQILKDALEPLDDRYDYVILDTSPGWNTLTINVLFYTQEVLTPVTLEVLTLKGLVEFRKSLAYIQKYNEDLSQVCAAHFPGWTSKEISGDTEAPPGLLWPAALPTGQV